MAIKSVIDAYVRRIERQSITIDNVPSIIRKDVERAIAAKQVQQEELDTEEAPQDNTNQEDTQTD